MNASTLCLVSALVFWPAIGSAELYKWTDDQGNFHITDTPPPAAPKKSRATLSPAPRSASPKKNTVRPILPGQPQAEVHPVPVPMVSSPPSEEGLLQRAMEGLSPSQATLTSSWQIFDGTQMNAKAPVQRWKDEQGLDHFVDVLPATLGRSETESQLEEVSLSSLSRRTKERVTGVSRSRRQPAP